MYTEKLCFVSGRPKKFRLSIVKKPFSVVAFLIFLSFATNAQKTGEIPAGSGTTFLKGERADPSTFTGNVWLKVLVPPDSTFNYHMANVTFEPGARTYWHKHPGGQILLVIEGIGYYQERGKPIQIIRAGDTIKCLPDTEHWHGASPQSQFSHIGITNFSPKGRVMWLKSVTDEEYNSLK